MNAYRVGAFAAKVGVHRNTVKEWDRTGCFPARRTPGSQRFHGRVSSGAQRPEREAQRQAELVEDPMSVVHTFSGRRYGLRRHGQKLREAAIDG